MRLKDKVAVVIGGSQGIGAAIAHRYAREGAKVAVVGSADLDKAQRVASRIMEAGGVASAHVADVRDARALQSLVDEVEYLHGPVDVLLNGAGVFYPTPAGATPAAEFERMVDINFKGSWNAISAVVPGMKARGAGRIVCIASAAHTYGVAPYAVYCATKAAIVQMVKALALELAPHGVRINAVAPGNTESPMNAEIRADVAALKRITAATPSGRAFSPAEDIAAIAVFLASDESRAMHGSVVLADEGISAGMAMQ
ncbi:SDR family NAD(P)-dependent oxidoreductase [Paraburkholderia fungorum]|uniref:SDR family NAD(P)-dependent oxidoreductase n=1 Tax=Paraburkholderia fungorum TaxID=134537 RepID=UPI00248DF56A|nr:SDR family NAD(P)-dependent oxidoreductase [Paraburkholderia fungorum]